MSVLLLLMLASLVVAGTFLGFFVWAVRRGQYEDMETPSMRLLTDEDEGSRTPPRLQKGKPPHEHVGDE